MKAPVLAAKLCIIVVFLGICIPAISLAQTFTPSSTKKYRCSVKNGEIKIKHKKFKKGRRLPGRKKAYNYSKLASKVSKLEGATSKKQRKLYRKLFAVMEVLLTCYDDQGIERPDGSPPGTAPGTPPGSGSSGGGGSGDGGGESSAFGEVRTILQNNCMSCHQSRGWELSEAYFLSQSLVVPGNHTESMLYRNLQGNPEGLQPATMPLSGSALSASELVTIRDWINGLETSSSDGHFACTPSLELAPSQMNRLSRLQLQNSLVDLIDFGLGNTDLAMFYVRWSAYALWEVLPNDYHSLGHARLDDRLDESYLEVVIDIVDNIARRIEEDGRLPQFVNSFVRSCDAGNYNSVSCREQFLQAFARRVFARPLSTEDFNFYRQPNSSGVTQASYRQIIISLLNAPAFLYHLEDAGTPVDSSELLLRTSAYEYVERISYAILNTIPDEQLIQYAEDGTADNNPQAVIDYVLNDQVSLARTGLRSLFEGWFQIEHYFEELARYFRYYHQWPELLAIDYGLGDAPLIPNSASNEQRYQLLGNYQDAAHNEILDLGTYFLIDLNQPVSELFLTRSAPVQDETLMRAYGLSTAWNGDVNSMPQVGPERAGVLGRAAMHFSSGLRSRPIMRGMRIRSDILCDPTGLPADNSTPDQVDTDAFEYVTGSTQHRTIALTQQPGTNCVNCHETLLNPLGFALEEFDPLGRRRSFEYVHEGYRGNDEIHERSFSTSVIPRINRTDTTAAQGTRGVSALIATSDEMHACFSRNLVRHVFDRVESDVFDGCMLNEVFEDSKQLSMREVLSRLLLSPQMRLRRLDSLPTQ